MDSSLGNTNQLKKQLLSLNAETKDTNNEEKIYLLISFDLKNSTQLKTEDEKWVNIIIDFYNMAIKSLNAIFPNYTGTSDFKVFKYIGDEIIFYRDIAGYKEIDTFLGNLYKVQELIIEQLTKFNSKVKLSVKTTAWIADVKKYISKPKNESDEYINAEIEIENTQNGFDLIGQDIDIGFRIAKYSYPNFITVSAKLAYLLINTSDNNSNNFKIMSYQTLKGVWQSHLYPIIWFCPKWNKINNEIPYEDFVNIKELENLKTENCDDIEYLENIFSDMNISEEMSDFCYKCETQITQEDIFVQKTID